MRISSHATCKKYSFCIRLTYSKINFFNYGINVADKAVHDLESVVFLTDAEIMAIALEIKLDAVGGESLYGLFYVGEHYFSYLRVGIVKTFAEVGAGYVVADKRTVFLSVVIKVFRAAAEVFCVVVGIVAVFFLPKIRNRGDAI